MASFSFKLVGTQHFSMYRCSSLTFQLLKTPCSTFNLHFFWGFTFASQSVRKVLPELQILYDWHTERMHISMYWFVPLTSSLEAFFIYLSNWLFLQHIQYLLILGEENHWTLLFFPVCYLTSWSYLTATH